MLPNMAPLNVSLSSGTPIVIGWADRTTALTQFTLPEIQDSTIETLINNKAYTQMEQLNLDIPNPVYRPLFKILRENRRVDGERTVPEKEFLLIWANTVNTNPIAIDAPNGVINPIMTAWLGKEEIISIDRLYHRPRLRFDHSKFASYAPPQPDGVPPSPPQAPGLDPHRPAYVAG